MNKYFPDMCRFIAHTLGEPDDHLTQLAYIGCWMKYDTPCICYQDDVILIVAATNSLAVHAVRKENNNPVLGSDPNGQVYRWHGEAGYLYNHLFHLFQQAHDKIKKDLDRHNENVKRWNEKKGCT